jgi:hypothetical protein
MTLPPTVPDYIRVEWRAAGTLTPSLLERKGHHALRQRTASWCRQHPAAASALPDWDPYVLTRVLEPDGSDANGHAP